jgi:CDP-glucose 4,6-dehydratase
MILQIMGRPDYPLDVQNSPLHEAQTLRLDIAKALSRLAWRPRLGVHDALTWTAQWYKQFYEEPAEARVVTEDQIRSFMDLMNPAVAASNLGEPAQSQK